jgi:hypothetical protein
VIRAAAPDRERLYDLMPAVYRERDAELGFPLRALLRIVADQAALVDKDIQQLWDDLFIETTRPWAIPYIGDLVSNNLLFDASRIASPDTAAELFTDLRGPNLRPPIAVRVRADVAKTIYYRRRKGTVPMLEELARDVTGWPAHAVEFFELLGWNQMLEHIRPQSAWTDIRSVERMGRVEGAFDDTSHTVDVRQIDQSEGWHGIHNVGFFLWRLHGYPLENVAARPVPGGPDWRYHFSPLGNPAPLFSRQRREGDEAGLTTELHVPAPIRRSFFEKDLRAYRDAGPPRADFTNLYGLFEPAPPSPLSPNPLASLVVFRNGEPIAPAFDPSAPAGPLYQPQIVCRRLDPWPATQPAGRLIAVDVQTGRLAVGDGWPDATTAVDVWFHYGFGSDLGGGPYERRPWLIRSDLESLQRRLWVSEGGTFPPGTVATDQFATLTDALIDWAAPAAAGIPPRANAVVTILDNRTYALPGAVMLRNEGWLAIEAADGRRPILQTATSGTALRVLVQPPVIAGDPDRQAALTLNGVVVEGSIRVTGDLGRLRLLHSTLVPGRRLTDTGAPETNDPSLVVDGGPANDPINDLLRIEAAFSITGPVVVPELTAGVWLLDCIVDGLGGTAFGGPLGGPDAAAGPPLFVERSTLLGETRTARLEASESIFTGLIDAVRTQQGCVRFSYVRPGSHTPQRYRCQPDTAVDAAIKAALVRDPALTQAERDEIRAFTESWLIPAFTSSEYGQPAYAQLRLRSPFEIRTGAEDGSEMGVFCHVKQPQRESNLRIRLDEYLPVGLDAGIVYVT